MNKLFWCIKKTVVPLLLAFVVAFLLPISSIAAQQGPDEGGGEGIPVIDSTGVSINQIVGNILDKLFDVCLWVGGGVLIYAFITFGISFAQDNPEQRARALLLIVAGALLVGIKILLSTIGLISIG